MGRIIPPGFETRGIDPQYPPGSDAYDDNVSSLRTVLGLHGVSNMVKNRRAKFLEGLLDTASAA